MDRYTSVSNDELDYISDLTLTFDDFEMVEEEALDDENFEKLKNYIINPDYNGSQKNK